MACGDVDRHSWSGVIMRSSCSSHGHQSSEDCQTVERLNMTLQKELPVFDSMQNVTYRSIACARCNSEGNLSFWGLDISCAISVGSIATPVNITAVKMFLKEHPDCSWKYLTRNLDKGYYHTRSCVLRDTQCASNQLPVLSVVRELCALYSLVFSVNDNLAYRNPHCALCYPAGRPLLEPSKSPGILPPLSILLDVSASISDPTQEPEHPTPTLITAPSVYNMTSQVINCSSNTGNCTATFGDACENVTLTKNQSTQLRFLLNKSHEMVLITNNKILEEKCDKAARKYHLCLVSRTTGWPQWTG